MVIPERLGPVKPRRPFSLPTRGGILGVISRTDNGKRRTEMSDVNDKLALARKIAEKKVGFIRHAITYVVVMVALALINNLTWGGYQWWLWAALGWGIGVVSHFLSAYLYQSGNMVDRLARKELEKMNESDKP
jgi:uncharacterized membrane protein YdbT with pleckstrin-like domain